MTACFICVLLSGLCYKIFFHLHSGYITLTGCSLHYSNCCQCAKWLSSQPVECSVSLHLSLITLGPLTFMLMHMVTVKPCSHWIRMPWGCVHHITGKKSQTKVKKVTEEIPKIVWLCLNEHQNAVRVINSAEKNKTNPLQPHITEMLIHTGLISSDELCFCHNMEQQRDL